MHRSIPPRTMADISRKMRRRERPEWRLGGGLRFQLGGRNLRFPKVQPFSERVFPTGVFQKPRSWRFQTKPLFKRIRGLSVDVFHEAEEMLIVIDLGGFSRGEVSLTMTPEKYLIWARRGEQEFREEISVPSEVDIEKCVENFRNGILEIVLPRKKGLAQGGKTT